VSGGSRFTQAVLKAIRESIAIALVVVALVLLTALFTFSPTDPGWSYSGEGGPVENRIGPFGALVADLLYFLFGRPAYLLPVMMLLAAWLLFRNRFSDLQPVTRANAAVRIGGFVLLLAASCGLTSLHWAADGLRATAGGVLGQSVGPALAGGLKPLGATLMLLAAWMAGAALAFHVSWISVMDGIGRGFWQAVSWFKAWLGTRRNVTEGQERKRERAEVVRQDKEKKKATPRAVPIIEQPAPVVEKSERVEKERQVPLFDSPKAGALPPLKLLDDPPERVAAYSPDALEAMSRLVEIKLQGLRRRGRSGRGASGAGGHALRDAPAPGVKVSQIRPRQGPGARAVSHQRARGRGHSRQVGHGPRDPQREARDGHARRDHQVPPTTK
jgi:S-DNA-T family DNA segregation ATPase FtsK/SpoIIIE